MSNFEELAQKLAIQYIDCKKNDLSATEYAREFIKVENEIRTELSKDNRYGYPISPDVFKP